MTFRSAGVLFAGLLLACGGRTPRRSFAEDAGDAAVEAPAMRTVASQEEIDVLPFLQQGVVLSAGPVVDFGEPQSARFLLAPFPFDTRRMNGDSWASVPARVRMRVPIEPETPPTGLHVRLRRARGRRVLVLVDGVPTRQALLPPDAQTGIATVHVPLPPERFRRESAEIELRFLGAPRVLSRPVAPTVYRGVAVPAPQGVAELDWVHLSADETPVQRVQELVADVRGVGAPRRSLVLYPPSSVSATFLLPSSAYLRAAFGADGVVGPAHPEVHGVVRVEADGVPAVEAAVDVAPGGAWQPVELDLRSMAGKVLRLTLRSTGARTTRLAFAEPRLRETSTHAVPVASNTVTRRALLIVLRGARFDRFLPALSERMSAGGWQRMLRESRRSIAIAASPRPVAALASVLTGLPAEVHGMQEWTDVLDENAPTLAAALRAAGVATAGFSDERWFIGSGLDEGFTTVESCPNDAAVCRSEPLFQRAVEWLANNRDRRSVAVVMTRATTPPFSPLPEVLSSIDPNPYDGAFSGDHAGFLATRTRRGALNFEPRELARLSALYDASLLEVDRSLRGVLDRLQSQRLLQDTLLLVVGDRGTALGESGLVGEGPASLASSMHTVLMARGPGIGAESVSGCVSVLDASATLLERLGVAGQGPWPERAGARSFALVNNGAQTHHGVLFVANARGEHGARFGELLAVPRGGQFALYAPENDAIGAVELSADRPIAMEFALTLVSEYRSSGADDPGPRTYQPSTRALPDLVAAALRSQGMLGR